MKKKIKKITRLTAKQYAEIHRLYWDEGWAQGDISLEFLGHDNQGHISRIINGPPPISWEERRQSKSAYSRGYKTPAAYKNPWMRKMVERNRSRSTVKLTMKDAQTIRHLYFQGIHSQVELARKYDISQGNISGIILGKHWKKL